MSSKSFAEGSEFGNYRIHGKIADGGMGSVYRACQMSLNRVVALKILSPHLTADASYVESFKRESQAAANLHHPNLIAVHDAGEVGGLHYYAMELVQGETLHQLLQRQGVLPERVALEVGISVASALQYAWDKARLIHRDIKPENIMIDTDGHVKLCDLGLAKTIGEAATTGGVVLGTPHYVSPEQARGEAHLDQRTDIYSLGMTLYHMVTGRLPFEGSSPAAVMAKHLAEQLADPREIVPTVSAGMCQLLEKMLAKRVEDRYRSWEEVIVDMQRVYERRMPLAAPLGSGASTLRRNPQLDSTPAVAPPVPAISAPAIGGKKRPAISLTVVAVVVLAMVVAGFGIFYDARRRSSVGPPLGRPPSAPEQTISPDALLERLENLARMHPEKSAELRSGLRKIISEFPDTASAVTARKRLEELAHKSYSEAVAFAEKNPTRYADIIAYFRRVATDFLDTDVAALAAQQVEQWTERRDRAGPPGEQQLEMLMKFAAENPEEFDEILTRLSEIAADFKGEPVGEQARRLFEDWTLKKQAAEQRREEERRKRLEERRRREEEAKRRLEQQERERKARVHAEMQFVEFGKLFLRALESRDYDGAVRLAQAAAAEQVLQPLKERVAGCLEAARQLQVFWANLLKDLPKLRGQEVSLQGISGTVDEVTASAIAIEKMAGASVSISLSALTTDEWLKLAIQLYGTQSGVMLLRYAWFCVAERRAADADSYFNQARASVAEAGAAQEVAAMLLRVPLSAEAVAAWTELCSHVEKQRWFDARKRLDIIRAKYASTELIQAARPELEQFEARVAAAERAAAEASATQLLADLRVCVERKQWVPASEHYRRLVSEFARTNAVGNAGKELLVMRDAIEWATGQPAGPDEDKERREMVRKRGGRIIIVAARAPRTGGRGPHGELIFDNLGDALEEARSGDAVEVWDGIYETAGLDKLPRHALLYGKAGAMPVICTKDTDFGGKLFEVFESLQIENLFLAGGTPADTNRRPSIFKSSGDKAGAVKLRNCVVGLGGVRMFTGAGRLSVEMEDCLLVNFLRLNDIAADSQFELNRCTLAGFKSIFAVVPTMSRTITLSLRNSVLAEGVICEAMFFNAPPQPPGQWGGGNRPGNVEQRDPLKVLKANVGYSGDRNLIVNSSNAVMREPPDTILNLAEWQNIYSGQDRNSVAQLTNKAAEIFMDAHSGDFRLKQENRAARIAEDGGPVGVRWTPWRWKAVLAKWQKLAGRGP